MSEATCIVDIRARVGESPVWIPEEKALYWAEIYKPAIHRFEPATGATRSWAMPEPVGSIAFRRGGGLVAGLRSGFAFVDLAAGGAEIVAAPEPEKPANTLFVTSAAQGVTEEGLKQQPHAGGVFALDVGVRGLPEPRFGD